MWIIARVDDWIACIRLVGTELLSFGCLSQIPDCQHINPGWFKCSDCGCGCRTQNMMVLWSELLYQFMYMSNGKPTSHYILVFVSAQKTPNYDKMKLDCTLILIVLCLFLWQKHQNLLKLRCPIFTFDTKLCNYSDFILISVYEVLLVLWFPHPKCLRQELTSRTNRVRYILSIDSSHVLYW